MNIDDFVDQICFPFPPTTSIARSNGRTSKTKKARQHNGNKNKRGNGDNNKVERTYIIIESYW